MGGVLLGGLLLALPQMYGVGYPVLDRAIDGRYVLGLPLMLMVGKIMATSLTIGIGGSGGVFAPSLFIGAMGGTAFGLVAQHLFPMITITPGMYGLIGMGAAFAGAARAAITAVIILFELTGDYTIILPLMLAIVMATALSHTLSQETIYTRKLTRRGVNLDATSSGSGPLGQTTVAAVMEPMPGPVAADQTVGNLAQMPPKITETSSLAEALDALVGAEGTGAPILTADKGRLVGWITHRIILTAVQPPTETSDAAQPGRRAQPVTVLRKARHAEGGKARAGP